MNNNSHTINVLRNYNSFVLATESLRLYDSSAKHLLHRFIRRKQHTKNRIPNRQEQDVRTMDNNRKGLSESQRHLDKQQRNRNRTGIDRHRQEVFNLMERV